MFRLIPLSSLSAGRRNPRRVKPERDAHRQLVASIRAVGLISPLTVCPRPDDPEQFRVVAGKRRLEALRAVYRGCDQDPMVKCDVIEVDSDTADTLSLAENFVREAMHPLDEAEAFAKLAHVEAKGVAAVAAEFGVTARYVKQRIKLAALADELKAAYREGAIDTATAEVFAGVPATRQLEVWRESDETIHHAQHAKNLIESRWIDTTHALFDIDDLPEEAVSRDLFHERVLIERNAFFEAQAGALGRQREALLEEGWDEVVISDRCEVYDRLHAMAYADPVFDETTQAKLHTIQLDREALEAEADGLDPQTDETRYDEICEAFDRLDAEEERIVADAEPHFDEATKAHGTVFLLLDADGRVSTEYRVPRPRRNGTPGATGVATGGLDKPRPVPGVGDLSERQVAAVLSHEMALLRRALLDHPKHRKVLLVMALHPSITHAGLSTKTGPDALAHYIQQQRGADGPGFVSAAWDAWRQEREDADPLDHDNWLDGDAVFGSLMALSEDELDRLIAVLATEQFVGSLLQRSALTATLASDLGVELRDGIERDVSSKGWCPDAGWLAGYRKIQLAQLIGELKGPAHGSAAERMKKSELVTQIAGWFAEAAAGRMDDLDFAARLNAWKPSCVVPVDSADADGLEDDLEVAA